MTDKFLRFSLSLFFLSLAYMHCGLALHVAVPALNSFTESQRRIAFDAKFAPQETCDPKLDTEENNRTCIAFEEACVLAGGIVSEGRCLAKPTGHARSVRPRLCVDESTRRMCTPWDLDGCKDIPEWSSQSAERLETMEMRIEKAERINRENRKRLFSLLE